MWRCFPFEKSLKSHRHRSLGPYLVVSDDFSFLKVIVTEGPPGSRACSFDGVSGLKVDQVGWDGGEAHYKQNDQKASSKDEGGKKVNGRATTKKVTLKMLNGEAETSVGTAKLEEKVVSQLSADEKVEHTASTRKLHFEKLRTVKPLMYGH